MFREKPVSPFLETVYVGPDYLGDSISHALAYSHSDEETEDMIDYLTRELIDERTLAYGSFGSRKKGSADLLSDWDVFVIKRDVSPYEATSAELSISDSSGIRRTITKTRGGYQPLIIKDRWIHITRENPYLESVVENSIMRKVFRSVQWHWVTDEKTLELIRELGRNAQPTFPPTHEVERPSVLQNLLRLLAG